MKPVFSSWARSGRRTFFCQSQPPSENNLHAIYLPLSFYISVTNSSARVYLFQLLYSFFLQVFFIHTQPRLQCPRSGILKITSIKKKKKNITRPPNVCGLRSLPSSLVLAFSRLLFTNFMYFLLC